MKTPCTGMQKKCFQRDFQETARWEHNSGPPPSPRNFHLDFPGLRISKLFFQNPETSKLWPDSFDLFPRNLPDQKKFWVEKKKFKLNDPSNCKPLVLQRTGFEGSNGKPWTFCGAVNRLPCIHCLQVSLMNAPILKWSEWTILAPFTSESFLLFHNFCP